VTVKLCKNCKFYTNKEGLKVMAICGYSGNLVFPRRRSCVRFEYKDELKDRTLGLFEE